MTLPTGFEALLPYVATWAVDSAAQRDRLRTTQSTAERQSFYDTMNPLLIAALDRLDAVSLAEHGSDEKNLMLLTLSYAHVALAVEVMGPDETKHAINRQRLPISRAPADA